MSDSDRPSSSGLLIGLALIAAIGGSFAWLNRGDQAQAPAPARVQTEPAAQPARAPHAPARPAEVSTPTPPTVSPPAPIPTPSPVPSEVAREPAPEPAPPEGPPHNGESLGAINSPPNFASTADARAWWTKQHDIASYARNGRIRLLAEHKAKAQEVENASDPEAARAEYERRLALIEGGVARADQIVEQIEAELNQLD